MIAARCLPEPFFKHGDEGGGGIVAQRLSRLLHRLPADQQLQREDQLQLMAPAAKAQPRFAHYQRARFRSLIANTAAHWLRVCQRAGSSAIIVTI